MNGFNQFPPFVFFILFLWSIFWKGLALWRAAKNNQIYWFIAFLLIQSVGILEIVYLFKFCKEKLTLDELKGIISLQALRTKSKK